MLESGECGSITELAAAERIDRSYLCRVLRLTLLAPELVETIVDGRQPERATLPALMEGFPVEWARQRVWQPAELSSPPYVGFSLKSYRSPEDLVEPIHAISGRRSEWRL